MSTIGSVNSDGHDDWQQPIASSGNIVPKNKECYV